jgi:DTW domain
MVLVDEVRVEEYLKQTRPSRSWARRSQCCGTSRCFYCSDCCTICIPEESLPVPILEGRFRLPFDVDIVLDEKERRASSTGIQLVSMFNAVESRRKQLCLEKSEKSITLYDLEYRAFPEYTSEEEGVYVLFPDKDSVPISSVSPTKLVVLDMKWSRTRTKDHPNLNALRKVHLSSPPAESRFWRWHNESPGMLSTIEAVFYASVEVTRDDPRWTMSERDDLIHMFWLFSLQRSVIHEKSEAEQRAPPFSEAGKSERRLLRFQTEKSRKRHLRKEIK